MPTSDAVIWESRKSFLQGAWEGGSFIAIPVRVALRLDGLRIERWYPLLWICFGFGLIAIYRVLTTPREVMIPATEISQLRIAKGWISNPIANRRFENNKQCLFKVTATLTNGTERRLRVMFTKDLINDLKQVPWIAKVVDF